MSAFNCEPVDQGFPEITNISILVDDVPYDPESNPVKPGTRVEIVPSVRFVATLTYKFYEENSGSSDPIQSGTTRYIDVEDLDPSNYPSNYCAPGTNLRCFVKSENSFGADTRDILVGLVNGIPPEEPETVDLNFIQSVFEITPEIGSIVKNGDEINFLVKDTFTPGNPDIDPESVSITINSETFTGSEFTYQVSETESNCTVSISNIVYSNFNDSIPGTSVTNLNPGSVGLFTIYDPASPVCNIPPGRCCYEGEDDPETGLPTGNCLQAIEEICTSIGGEYTAGEECPDCELDESVGLPCCDAKPRGRCCYMIQGQPLPGGFIQCYDNLTESQCIEGGEFTAGATCYYNYNENYEKPDDDIWDIAQIIGYDEIRMREQCENDPGGARCGCLGSCCEDGDCQDSNGGTILQLNFCPVSSQFFSGKKCIDCNTNQSNDFLEACCGDISDFPVEYTTHVLFWGNPGWIPGSDDESLFVDCYTVDETENRWQTQDYNDRIDSIQNSNGLYRVYEDTACRGYRRFNTSAGCYAQRAFPAQSNNQNPCYHRNTKNSDPPFFPPAPYPGEYRYYGDDSGPDFTACELDSFCSCYSTHSEGFCGYGGPATSTGGKPSDILRSACEEVICQTDPDCCYTAWDGGGFCAEAARARCHLGDSDFRSKIGTSYINDIVKSLAYYFANPLQCGLTDNEPCVRNYTQISGFYTCLELLGLHGNPSNNDWGINNLYKDSLAELRDAGCPGDWTQVRS